MRKKLLKYDEFRNDIFESVVKRGKDHKMFDYGSIIADLWRPIVLEAQDFQNIKFDLENDDDEEKKTIYFDQLLRLNQPVKTEINAVLCRAGGDWEHPVLYFKLEFTHDHFITSNRANPAEYIWDFTTEERTKKNDRLNYNISKKYCLIPGPEINYLCESKNGGYCAHTDETIKEAGLKEKDMKVNKELYQKAWKWLEDLLEKLAKDRHELLGQYANRSASKEQIEKCIKMSNLPEDFDIDTMLKDADKDIKGNQPQPIEEAPKELQPKKESVSNGNCTCNNCGWQWELEDDDENPFLCHKCGYDDQLKEFDTASLKKWKEENGISENLIYHLEKSVPVTESVFRPGSEAFFELLKETREIFDTKEIELCDIDQELYENTDIGRFEMFEGELVPLDLPMEYEEVNEAEYNGKKVKLNYPKRGGKKKYYVYVKNPDSGKVNKLEFGDTTGLKAKVSDSEARKSFAARHKCDTKKDKTKAGYWACRINKYGHLWGGKTYPGYW